MKILSKMERVEKYSLQAGVHVVQFGEKVLQINIESSEFISVKEVYNLREICPEKMQVDTVLPALANFIDSKLLEKPSNYIVRRRDIRKCGKTTVPAIVIEEIVHVSGGHGTFRVERSVEEPFAEFGYWDSPTWLLPYLSEVLHTEEGKEVVLPTFYVDEELNEMFLIKLEPETEG